MKIIRKKHGIVADIATSQNGIRHKSYTTWSNIINKCYNDKHKLYKWVGEKGIKVCDDWRIFSMFKEWYDKNYIEGSMLLLKDGSMEYSPDTCYFEIQKTKKQSIIERARVSDVDVDDPYIVFKRFFFHNLGLIKRTTAYSGLTNEELEQECAIAFFSDSIIIKLFLDKENEIAFSEFQKYLIKSLQDFNTTGTYIKDNIDYSKEKLAIERVNISFEESLDLEEDIMRELELQRLKRVHGKEQIDTILEYYELGCELFAKKHNISEGTARIRIHRMVSKIKEKEKILYPEK